MNRNIQRPNIPLIRGPFRGIILIFHKDTNFDEVEKIHSNITFKHPNYYRSTNDKHKCVIYYKNPYDAAMVIDTHKENPNFQVYLYHDELSKTLRPDILYITGELTSKLNHILQQINGTIIKQSRLGMQVKFESFKAAAIAHEEIRKNHSVKFTYKSQVPYLIARESGPEAVKLNRSAKPPKLEYSKTGQSMNEMLKQYKDMSPAMKKEFRNTLEKINENENNNRNLNRIQEAASNLDLANVSNWNKIMEDDNVSEESVPWDAMGMSPNEMLEMHKTYKEIMKRAEK